MSYELRQQWAVDGSGSDAANMMVVKRGHDVCVPTGNIAKRSHACAGKVIHWYRATWMMRERVAAWWMEACRHDVFICMQKIMNVGGLTKFKN